METGGSCQVQDSLSCGVCFERYDGATHLPKILPCQHTFCNSCIDSLIDDSNVLDAFECPVCRGQVCSDEVRTNLVVIDIVEAVVAKEKAKLFCLKHPTKECQLVCIDCLQMLCAMCMIKAEHNGHAGVDIDDAKVSVKKRLSASLDTKIANMEKATAAKVDKMKLELAQQEQDMNTRLNTVIYMITQALNEWKKTQLQKAQQAIDKELETSKAQQESLTEKLQLSDLQSIMSACKEVESKEAEVEAISIDVSLPKISLEELQNKMISLCDMIQTLIKGNDILPSSQLSPTSSSPEDTDESHISWDFIVQLCSCAVQQKGPSRHPYIPQCVKRVANMYNHNRNTQFYGVVHYKQEGHDQLVSKTDDFIFIYNYKENQKNSVEGLWNPRASQWVKFMEKAKDVLHDQEYATKIKYALDAFQATLDCYVRKGRPELWWEIQK